MRWISDDGRVQVSASTSGNVLIKVDGRMMVGYLRGPGGWIAGGGNGDDRYTIVVKRVGDEIAVSHVWMKPWAEGTEADPRTGSEEWRCGRLIEGCADHA